MNDKFIYLVHNVSVEGNDQVMYACKDERNAEMEVDRLQREDTSSFFYVQQIIIMDV